jgi:hypothetical protein
MRLALLWRGTPWAALALMTTVGCGRPASRPHDPADSGRFEVAQADVAEQVPLVATPADALSTETLEHTELLRIGRDFGKREFEIALDAWVERDSPRELALVRLWWARVDRDLERSPLGPRTRRHFEIESDRVASDHWRIHLVSDDKVFSFDVELDDAGKPEAYAAVQSLDGDRLAHCRVDRGEIEARRVIGVVAGIDRLAVQCTDPTGSTRSGHVVWTPATR